ncbi:unnamed protein product [Pleuronectes platessa]|uniref:Uncharacterized protein n=1 Tax=Pleuronectes platessa TaxID=8262 RepID=A0A9N7V5H4_PLEPL|nr:unnamed protein product [Pleuronectes platessa]
MVVNCSLTVIYWTFLLGDAYFKWMLEPEDKPTKKRLESFSQSRLFTTSANLDVLSIYAQVNEKKAEEPFRVLITRLDVWAQTGGG